MNQRSRFPLAALTALLASTSAFAANPGSATTSSGQTLNIQIDSPVDGATVAAGPLSVSGRVSIGDLTADASVLYVMDNSLSLQSPRNLDCNGDGVVNAGDDLTGEGRIGDVLDCEVSGVIALNNSLSAVVGLEAGLISFAGAAVQRDVNFQLAGVQAFTAVNADNDSNGVGDIEQAVRGLPYNSGTNFNVALAAMNTAFATRPAGELHVAFFLSDGAGSLSTGPATPLGMAAAAGTRVFTYSVGAGATGCNVGAGLRTIADQTGGTCTVVTNPALLSGTLAGSTPAGIDRVEVSVDGINPVTATLDALGNFRADTTLVGAGTHSIAATVTATDATMATADISVNAGNPEADLSIFKSARETIVRVGDTVRYDLLVRNAGPASATGVTVSDTLPAGTALVSAQSGQGSCGYVAPTLTCVLDTVASGVEASVALVVGTQSSGEIVNTAAVFANEPDPTPHDNSSSVSVTVNKRQTALIAKPALLTAASAGNPLLVHLRFEAQLSSEDSGVAGEPITFTAGSQSCSATTNASGAAVCTLTVPRLLATTLQLGYDVRYAGDDKYLPTQAHGPVVKVLAVPVL